MKKRLNLENILMGSFFLIILAFQPGWKWPAIYLSASALLLYFNKMDLKVPKLGHIYSIIFALLVIGFLHSETYPGHYQSHITDWLCFFIIMLAGFNSKNMQSLSKINKVATICCFALGLYQYYFKDGFPYSILGHANLTSEFLGVSLLIQFASYSYALIPFTIAHIFILYCRSVWVALLFSLPLFIYMAKIPIKKVFPQFGKAIIIIAILTLSKGSELTSQPGKYSVGMSKKESTEIRLTRWENTINMIKQNPFGVGPGNFEWGYSPYAKGDPELKPRNNIESPHNGYLELIVEWGFPAAILFLVGLFLVLKKIYWYGFGLCVVIYFMIDAFFSFPMMLGFPFFK